MFSQACVKNSVHGVGAGYIPACIGPDTPCPVHAGIHTSLPSAWWDAPPGRHPPPWPLQWTVRILLECILCQYVSIPRSCILKFQLVCYCPPMKLREGDVFSPVSLSICHSVHGWGSHVTITHDALYVIVLNTQPCAMSQSWPWLCKTPSHPTPVQGPGPPLFKLVHLRTSGNQCLHLVTGY